MRITQNFVLFITLFISERQFRARELVEILVIISPLFFIHCTAENYKLTTLFHITFNIGK